MSHVFDGPLRYGASVRFDNAADMFKHGRAVPRQMLNKLDRAPLGPAEQLRQLSAPRMTILGASSGNGTSGDLTAQQRERYQRLVADVRGHLANKE